MQVAQESHEISHSCPLYLAFYKLSIFRNSPYVEASESRDEGNLRGEQNEWAVSCVLRASQLLLPLCLAAWNWVGDQIFLFPRQL